MFNRKLYLRNIAFNQASFVAAIASGFLVSPFIVRHLGDSGNGYWSLVAAITAYFGYFDLGIHSGIGHYITRHLASGDRGKLNATFNSALAALLGIGLLAAAGSVVLAACLPRFFRVPPEAVEPVRAALLLMGLVTAMKFPLSAFHGVLAGAQRYDLMSGASLAARIVNACLVYLALTGRHGLPGLAVAVACTQILEGLAGMAFALRVVPEIRVRPAFSRKPFAELFEYGAFNFLINISAQFGAGFGAFIIGRELDAAAVTYYTIASEITPYMANLVAALTMPLLQVVIPMDVRGDLRAIKSLYLKGSRYMFAVVCLMGLNLVLVGDRFLARWMGEKYLDPAPYGSSGTVLLILTLAAMAALSSTVSQQILFGRRKNRSFAAVILLETLLIVGLSCLAAPRWGIAGVAGAVLAASILTEGLLLNALAGRHAGSSLAEFARSAIVPNLAVGAATFAIGRTLLPYVPGEGYAAVFLSFGLVSAFHLACALAFLVERRDVHSLAGHAAGFLKSRAAVGAGSD